MKETIGFIGLGDLGLPIARNLLAAGHALKVYNRTASKAEPLITLGRSRCFNRATFWHAGVSWYQLSGMIRHWKVL